MQLSKVHQFLGLIILAVVVSARNIDDKIVNGQDATQGQFPYQVSIYIGSYGFFEWDSNFCGGSIYNKGVVITAAHCCEDMDDFLAPIWAFDIIAGELDLTKESGKEQISTIREFLIHPNYTSASTGSDICLLYLEKHFDLGEDKDALPVKLPETEPDVGDLCTISGWGDLQSSGNSPDILQWVDVPIVSDEDCGENYSTFDEETMICAGGEDKDTCQGDSGGPMVCNGVLTGITSFGRGCATPGYPGVYTEVLEFADWIEENGIPMDEPTTTTTTTEVTTTTMTTDSGSKPQVLSGLIVLIISIAVLFH